MRGQDNQQSDMFSYLSPEQSQEEDPALSNEIKRGTLTIKDALKILDERAAPGALGVL